MVKRNKKLKPVAKGNDDEIVAEAQVDQHEGNKRKLRKGAETECSESDEEIKPPMLPSPVSGSKKKKRKKAGDDSPVATTSKVSAIRQTSSVPGPSGLAPKAKRTRTRSISSTHRKANKTAEETETESEGMRIVTTMSADDLEEFLNRMESQSPLDDIKRVPERESMIDWENVSFSCYGPHQCKQAWLYLSNQTRKYRIVHELVGEMRVKLKTDYKKLMRKMIESSPEFPVKPYAMGPFQLYCKELWDKHKDQHDKMNTKTDQFFDFQRKCYETWGILSADDKKDFEDRVKIIAAEYKRKVKEFYSQFPLFDPGNKPIKEDKPEKPISLKRQRTNQKIANEIYSDAPPLPLPPFKVFINAKLNRLDPPPSSDELPELKQHFVDKWKRMTKKKKLKWIESCVRKCERFVEDIKAYKKQNPGYLLPIDFQISKLISKEEFKVWADANGSPPNPKLTIFDYYLEEFAKTGEAAEIENPEDIRKVATKKFEELDWYNKEMYKMRFQMQKVEFKQKLLEYFNELPVILRKIALDCINKSHRKILQEEVNKEPLVFDDEQPESGNGEEPTQTRKRQKNDGVETESQTELDETVEGESPKKKKKKKKKKRTPVEEDEQPVIEQEEIIQNNDATNKSSGRNRKKAIDNTQASQFFPGKIITPRKKAK